MRFVFMGSPRFAVPSLNALVHAGHEIAAVYCQPPRAAGRGKGDRKTAVHERAGQLGLLVRTPKTLRDAAEQERFRALEPDLAVVAAYGLILPRAILDAPRQGCINVHASLLPRWRGAAPIQRAILAGDKVSGVTIMQMEEGLDTGPILLQHNLEISGKNAGQVTEELAKIGSMALLDWLKHPTTPVSQPEDGVTYASKIDKAEARIDWTRSAEEIDRQVRAFNPMPGAWFEALGERIKLLEADFIAETRGKAGEVLDESLSIACGTGYIRPLKLQRASRSAMTPSEMLRGFPIHKGTILP